VVPLTSFSEFNKAEGGDIWFAFDESRPLAFFAGIWTRWKSIRKVKEGETENDLFAFLTTGQTPSLRRSIRRRCLWF
jgi:putative SOS response-associated peptidase YedK